MNEWQRIPKARRDDECAKRLARCIDLFDFIDASAHLSIECRTELVRAAQVEPGALRELALGRLALQVYGPPPAPKGDAADKVAP